MAAVPHLLFVADGLTREMTELILQYLGVTCPPSPGTILGPHGHLQILADAITVAIQLRLKFQEVLRCKQH